MANLTHLWRKNHLHGSARDEKVNDTIHKGTKYCSKQCNFVARNDKPDDVDYHCSHNKSNKSSAKRCCINTDYSLNEVIEDCDYSSSYN